MEFTTSSLFALREHEKNLLTHSIDAKLVKMHKRPRKVTFKEGEGKRGGGQLEDMLASIKRKIRNKYEE